MNYTIKLKSDGSFQNIDSGKTELSPMEEIIVESEHGVEVASVVPNCATGAEKIDSEGESGPKIEMIFIRKVNDKDREKIKSLAIEAKNYLTECKDKVEKFKLPMELLDADLTLDEKKLTFYFTAPSRVDFRSLVSDLARNFKKIIRLQQVGTRDETRYLGGVGRCGMPFCCQRFLKGNLESVTLDMAVDQNLAQMGAGRITGCCGKLMCCLKFELAEYKKNKAKLPKIGDQYESKNGKGVVVKQNILEKKVTIKLNDDDKYLEVDCSKSE